MWASPTFFLAATVTGGHRLMTNYLPGYRRAIASFVSALAGSQSNYTNRQAFLRQYNIDPGRYKN